uniref:hypothetical protein n=1 Tax=Flavobacterium sp. TaxID=239 RepID=UPI0040499A10
MRILSIILLFTFLQADTKNELKNNQVIEITLKNKAIYFIDIDPENDFYKDSIEREKSFNVVEIEFKNTSNDKMLLFINSEEMTFYSGHDDAYNYYFEHTGFIDAGNTKPEGKYKMFDFKKYPEGLDNIENHKSDVRKMKYKNLNLKEREKTAFEMFEKYAFYLGSNETKTVYFHVKLPLLNEASYDLQQNPSGYINLKEGWHFKFRYEAHSKNIYKDLPYFVKEELHNNKIEIFDGEIVSNAVKLKKR